MPAWGAPRSELANVSAEGWPVHATREWAFGGADGAGVRVCLLDSGVDATHPLVGPVETSMNIGIDTDGIARVVPAPPVDRAGHGTACASIIRSLAPRCELASVAVLSGGFHGDGRALVAALEWAIDEGYDVINLSLSTVKPSTRAALAELCDTAYFRRTIICAAAHNAPVVSFPWRFGTVISVASTTDGESHGYNVAPPVEFLAPGVAVQAAWTGHAVIRVTGNSFAAPYVSGLCAQLLSKHPALTSFEVKTALYLTATNVEVGDHESVD